MPNSSAILWLKQQFGHAITVAVQDTLFSRDLIVAIACQETGYIWNVLRAKVPVDRVLELCVGDTLDEDKGRRAFPRTKAALLAAPRGDEMFALGHQVLVDMAQHIPAYGPAAHNPNKFCHGYGLFQYDLQFFRTDPEYFLQKRYAVFANTLDKCLSELREALRRTGWEAKPALTDYESACVAIAYNTGRFIPSKGLKQGYFDGTRYYGEAIFDFLRLSKTVEWPDGTPAVIAPPVPGTSPLVPPSPVTATGAFYEVDVRESPLNLRREPAKDPAHPKANVITTLPDGQIVRAVTNRAVNGFLEIETSLSGARLRGFVSKQFLKAAPAVAEVPVVTPAPTPPTSGVTAVYMPRHAGTITRRTEPANAHSLNEAGEPGRTGETAPVRCAELAAIIAWLAVDQPAHRRYQPRPGVTFCNIYAHDYCFLAGCYLPRVWWTGKALVALAQGRPVAPLYGDTIAEIRANDLLRWLHDFGPTFGWRRTGSLTTLQTEVNLGAVGLIVARQKDEHRSGHIVAVVPETDAQHARRDATGEVIAPLQSQAGAVNFQYGTSRLNWWLDPQRFAESAFWLHA